MSFLPLPPASHLLEINIGFICGKVAIGEAKNGREKPSGALWASPLVFACGDALHTCCCLSTASTAFVPRLFTRPLFSPSSSAWRYGPCPLRVLQSKPPVALKAQQPGVVQVLEPKEAPQDCWHLPRGTPCMLLTHNICVCSQGTGPADRFEGTC